MKWNNMFRDQVNSVTTWFGSWNTCEKIVVLYSLLKQIPTLHCQFLVQMLQQRINEDKEVQALEEEANNPGFVCQLSREDKDKVIQGLLNHLPLLHSGNIEAKNEYLQLIPDILAHSLDNHVFIEESRQLLSYSLIHPAITSEERSKFNMWLGQLDECYNSPPPQTQVKADQGQGHLQGQNGITMPHHIPISKQSAVGSERLNGWNNNMCESLNINGLEGHNGGLEGHSGSQGNLYGNSHHFQTGQHIHPAMSGHMPLNATLSAPTNFKPMVPPPSSSHQHQQPPQTSQSFAPSHAPLRRMKSFAPPNTLNIANVVVSDWLQSNDNHLIQGPGRPGSVLSDHAPLSPQSSTASSGSGSDHHADDSIRNTFMEESSGMRDVPLWLKSLRLHKYAHIFQQLTYEEMMNITEEWLESQSITKGARNKIVISIRKLQERQNSLRNLERDIMDGGPIKICISEMKAMLNTPIKAFVKPGTEGQGQLGSLNSPGAGGDADNSIQEGDLPGQFTRLMTKVCTQLMLTTPYDDEGFNMFLQLAEKCINHEAFSQKQRKLLDSFKVQARKMWQPAPVKYSFDKKARPYWGNYSWGNTFPAGSGYNNNNHRPVQWTVKTPPRQAPTTMWSFGAKRSVVGSTMSTGHLPVQRNNSHSTAILQRQNMMEQAVKQPLARTHSAPMRSPGIGFGNQMQMNEPPASDTEINARLDSLCRSVTECALGSYN